MSEEEAERQFISDLEKAKALSMESQALEEFRYGAIHKILIVIQSNLDNRTNPVIEIAI
jgi:septation ring formation regulator EzrA